ncbi:adenylate/guanylate cyclase domain-containing protein [Microseira wollei]|uniref:Adenylate cyclase n=1 Tax=Microseira wollei NIES-4236 TaxID=2530354 RepID=A0AAV3X7A2_9CYAN|nr:adenylate/guanylate cyclase domain-containing protein [Microseira wollei]GET35965.1 adenylate cyclase [Microseira wollei NIES-4236]
MNTLVKQLLTHLLPNRNLEYLAVDREFNILEMSEGVERFADDPNQVKLGQDVRFGFPELFGCEEILIDVLEGREKSFNLKAIGRLLDPHNPLYVDILIVSDKYSEEKLQERLFFLIEDVTKQMVLEQNLVQGYNETSLLASAMAAAKHYLDGIINAMAEVLLVTNNLGNIKTVNQAAIDLFGYSEGELIDQPISAIASDGKILLQAIESRYGQQNEVFKDLTIVCKTKTGKKIDVAFSCSAIETEIEGITDFVYVGRDITERLRAEKRKAAQYAITRSLSESATLSVAAPKILSALCEHLGWDVGQLWIPNQQAIPPANAGESCPIPILLRCAQQWVKPSVSISEFANLTWHSSFELGVGLAGRVWQNCSPLWMTDVVDDANFPLASLASQQGLHEALGFPIMGNGEVLGVMTFFGREVEPPDADLLQVMAAIGSQIGQYMKRKQAEEALRYQQQQTDRLLLNILPATIAERLKKDQRTIAEHFAEVSVLFGDIVGFTELSTRISPTELVHMLNAIFSEFDYLADRHGLEKIKTIGDAYMVVGGIPLPKPDHALAVAEMALDMQATMVQFNAETGQNFRMRIGIHTGPVTAGVIGVKKFIYDLWGDTVNTASRMESHGIPGEIQVTQDTYDRLRDRFWLQERGLIAVKGKGEMMAYLLKGRK